MTTQLYLAEGIVRARVLEAKDAALVREVDLARESARRGWRWGR
ncbi:MAG: hypothetical protein V9F00_07255 [Nocardioides sp.]